MSAGGDAAESAKDDPEETRARRLARVGLSVEQAALYLLVDVARCTGAPTDASEAVARMAERIRAVW